MDAPPAIHRMRIVSDPHLPHDQPVYKLVLTGGPCGGKTTAMARLTDFFRRCGFRVYTIPEAATTFFMNGITYTDLTNKQTQFWFQDAVMNFQMALEDGVERVARSNRQPSVLLCDRGVMDGAAYMSEEGWKDLLKSKSLDTLEIREGRYDAVFHLVTAAEGAESYYTLLNNITRTETPEFARELDLKTQGVWNGHPRHYVVDNRSDFEGKMQRVERLAAKLVGLPHLPRVGHRFKLLASPRLEDFTIPHEAIDLKKVYILGEPTSTTKDGRKIIDEYNYVEERSTRGVSVYGHTCKRKLDDGHQVEIKRIISAREFRVYVEANADPARPAVRQKRYTFIWQNMGFIIICHRGKDGDVWTLRRLSEDEDNLAFPPFLAVGDQLTDEEELMLIESRSQVK